MLTEKHTFKLSVVTSETAVIPRTTDAEAESGLRCPCVPTSFSSK